MKYWIRMFRVIRDWRNITWLWTGRLSLAFISLTITVEIMAGEAERSAAVEYGAYLTRIGNCMGCHTTKGGQPFAGGRRLSTSFGVFITPNITPDKETELVYGVSRISGRPCIRANRVMDGFYILLFPILNIPKRRGRTPMQFLLICSRYLLFRRLIQRTIFSFLIIPNHCLRSGALCILKRAFMSRINPRAQHGIGVPIWYKDWVIAMPAILLAICWGRVRMRH